MSETNTDAAAGKANVLARKLAASKEEPGGRAGTLTLKALRRALARAAADLCDLPVAVLAGRQANVPPEELAEQLSDKDLLVVLDGPNGRIGAISLDAPTVAALIQKQTMGVVLGKAPSERNYTPTDAAMTAEFLERALEKVVSLLDGEKDRMIFDGYRFGAQVEDVRSLVLGLEAADYRVIDLSLDLSSGLMQGKMVMVLPEPSAEELNGGDAVAGMGLSLGSSMGTLRAEMTAVLCKMRIPLKDFAALKEGDVLPLEQAFLYETDLRAVNGQSIAQGRLGQLNGARAVRLNEPKTKLVEDHSAGDSGFTAQIGAEQPLSLPDAAPAFDMEIAAQGLQDPVDEGFGNDLDLGAGLDDLPPLDGGAMDLDGGLAAAPMEMGDLGGAPLAGGLPDLPEPGMAPFGDDTAAEISELAGLDDGLGLPQ